MDFQDHYANLRFLTYQASLPDCLIFGAGSKILLRQIRHHFPAWYQAMPDWSGTCQIKIRGQPDRSGCCLIKIRHAWYQANLSAWSILLRQIRRSGKRRKFVRSLGESKSWAILQTLMFTAVLIAYIYVPWFSEPPVNMLPWLTRTIYRAP